MKSARHCSKYPDRQLTDATHSVAASDADRLYRESRGHNGSPLPAPPSSEETHSVAGPSSIRSDDAREGDTLRWVGRQPRREAESHIHGANFNGRLSPEHSIAAPVDRAQSICRARMPRSKVQVRPASERYANAGTLARHRTAFRNGTEPTFPWSKGASLVIPIVPQPGDTGSGIPSGQEPRSAEGQSIGIGWVFLTSDLYALCARYHRKHPTISVVNPTMARMISHQPARSRSGALSSIASVGWARLS